MIVGMIVRFSCCACASCVSAFDFMSSLLEQEYYPSSLCNFSISFCPIFVNVHVPEQLLLVFCLYDACCICYRLTYRQHRSNTRSARTVKDEWEWICEIVLIHYIIILVKKSARGLQVLRHRNFTNMTQTCIYLSFATKVSQLRIWQFWVIGIERNVCRCTFNRCSAIAQFAKFAAGEQLCRRCTHRTL